MAFVFDPYENRTRVTAVKGRCLNRLTNGPNHKTDFVVYDVCLMLVAEVGLEPTTYRV